MILDVTVGAHKIYCGWEKKLNDPLIGIDIRKGDISYKNENMWRAWTRSINPTVLADMRFLPFHENVFDAIIFDPPHTNASLDTWIAKAYGSWTQHETIQTLRMANDEFIRVLRPRGTLILKVMPRQFPLYETLLKNFTFFLPISTYRTRGSFQDKRKSQAALWAIGQANQ